MNDRYKSINQKLKDWKNQDKNILKTIFEHSNPTTVISKKDTSTGFQNLPLEDLYKLFDKNFINNMDNDKVSNLLQEVHNRYMKSNNFELSRSVLYGEDAYNNYLGYVTYNDNKLFINKSVFGKIFSKGKNYKALNKENAGLALLNTILHESRHLVQYDSFLKLLLNEPQSEEEKFLGAIAGINNINFNIANSNYDYKYIPNWNDMYGYQYLEHDAYYNGLKETQKYAEKYYSDDKNYHKLLTSLSNKLGKTPSIMPTTDLKIKSQAKHIEKYLKEQIKYFKNGTQDCELKSKILDTVEHFMEVDENGNSLLRNKLTREITEMRECYNNSLKISKLKDTELTA